MATKKTEGESALAAELSALKQQMSEQDARHKQDLYRFMSTPQTQPAAVQQQANEPTIDVNLDLSGLPNPTDDPDGFQKKLGKRMKGALREGLGKIQDAIPDAPIIDRNAAAREKAYTDLWNNFQTDYKDLAKFEGEIRTVVALRVAELASQNINPDLYILANPKQFETEIAERATKHLEGLGVDTASVDGEEDNTAALSIFGGRPNGDLGGESRKSSKGGEKQSNLVDELKAVQVRMGLYGNRVEH